MIDLQREGFDSVRLLGRYQYARARRELPIHNHGQMLEICYLESGQQTYVVRGREYALSGGDVFLTFPGERHGTGNHPESRGVLYWLLLSMPQAHRRLLGLPETEGKVILRLLRKAPRRQFRARAALPLILRSIFHCHESRNDPLRIVKLRSLLLQLLLEVIDSAYDDHPPHPSDPIQTVLRYIESHLEQCPRLSELADAANLSLPRLKSRFKAEIGISPADYILRARISRAIELLRQTDEPITSIAMRLGFSSSQYFATVFKRYTFHTPHEARRHAAKL